MKKFGLLVISACLLTSCSHLESSGDKNYLQSQNGVPVVVPPPLSDANISHYYDLPPQKTNPNVPIEPPPVEIRQESS